MGLADADHWAEGDEAQMLVKLQLLSGAGDDSKVAALIPEMLGNQSNQFGENKAVAKIFFH